MIKTTTKTNREKTHKTKQNKNTLISKFLPFIQRNKMKAESQNNCTTTDHKTCTTWGMDYHAMKTDVIHHQRVTRPKGAGK